MTSTKRSRVLAIGLTMGMVAAGLSACGSGSAGGDGGATKIRVSNWDGGINDDVVAAFHKVHPDIDVEVLTYPDDYSQKITTMVTGGNAPDVMLLWEGDFAEFAASGVLEPLDDRVAGQSDFTTDDFIPAVDELIDRTGGTYGLPWCYASELLFYNKDLFDAAGVAYPAEDWTWDDFREAAIALTGEQDGQKIWGADALTAGSSVWYSMAGQAGDEVLDSDGKLALGSGLQKALEFQHQLTSEDKVSPEPSTGDSIGDLFAAGQATMTRAGSWLIGTYRDVKFNWDVTTLPSQERDYATLHTGLYTIGKDSRNKDAAWTFIQFMMSDDGQAMTSESTSNPSAIKRLADSDSWQKAGTGGPTNWDAIAASSETGSFGETLAPATVTSNLANDFGSYLLGVFSLDEVMQRASAAADAAS